MLREKKKNSRALLLSSDLLCEFKRNIWWMPDVCITSYMYQVPNFSKPCEGLREKGRGGGNACGSTKVFGFFLSMCFLGADFSCINSWKIIICVGDMEISFNTLVQIENLPYCDSASVHAESFL